MLATSIISMEYAVHICKSFFGEVKNALQEIKAENMQINRLKNSCFEAWESLKASIAHLISKNEFN